MQDLAYPAAKVERAYLILELYFVLNVTEHMHMLSCKTMATRFSRSPAAGSSHHNAFWRQPGGFSYG